MKKLFITGLLTIALSGFAQEGTKTWSEKKLEKTTLELSLTAEQQQLIKPIYDEMEALKADTKANPGNAKVNKEKGNKLGKKRDAVLTPEQLALQKKLNAK